MNYLPAINRQGTPMLPTPDTQFRIAELRDKARQGLLSIDDCKDAINFLREARSAAPAPGSYKPRGAGSKPAAPDADALLGELGI